MREVVGERQLLQQPHLGPWEGAPITMTGGHICEHGRMADGVDGVRLAVREQLEPDTSAIKLMASGGISTPEIRAYPHFRSKRWRQVVKPQTALRCWFPRTPAHAGITIAIRAGVDTIERRTFADDAAHQLTIERNITLVPTVIALGRIAPDSGIPSMTVQKGISALETYRVNTAKAIAAGIGIVAGTDAGSVFNPIGDLLYEVRISPDLAMTPTEALRTATITAGKLLRRPGESVPAGMIEMRARAD